MIIEAYGIKGWKREMWRKVFKGWGTADRGASELGIVDIHAPVEPSAHAAKPAIDASHLPRVH